jgi:hypothetical protein
MDSLFYRVEFFAMVVAACLPAFVACLSAFDVCVTDEPTRRAGGYR